MQNTTRKLILSLCALLLVACSGAAPDPYANFSAKQLFDDAKVALNAGDFAEAVKLLEALEARYPFGRYALQAQLDIAYAYYKQDEIDSAIAACDRFIKLNPRHYAVDYAWYLRGLANYNRGRGILESIAPREFAEFDQSVLATAYRDFETLVTRYPSSRYAEDASQRMNYLRNQMAAHEYHVAEYYFRRGALIGSINRLKYLIEHYDGAPIVSDALVLMIKAYRDLKLDTLASDTLKLLQHNFPQHPELETLQKPASS